MLCLYAAAVPPLLEKSAFDGGLARVGPERRSRVLSLPEGPARARSLAAGLLLLYLAEQHGCSDRCRLAESGKPYLTDRPELAFSLSHSGDYALCAGGIGGPLGADLEPFGNYRPALARRVFSPEETAYLEALPPGRQGAAFTALWTAKESLIKKTGRGLMLPLPFLTPPFDGPEIVPLGDETPCRIRWYHDIPGYLAALCAEPNQPLPAAVTLLKL